MRYLHKRYFVAALLGLSIAWGLAFGPATTQHHSHSIPAGMLAEDPGGESGGGG